MNPIKPKLLTSSRMSIATFVVAMLIILSNALPVFAANVISIPPLTVTKITHGCGYAITRNIVYDTFVSADGAGGTAAQPFVANFAGVANPVVVYTLRAPPGKRFVLDPRGQQAWFLVFLDFTDRTVVDVYSHPAVMNFSYENPIGDVPSSFSSNPMFLSVSDNSHSVWLGPTGGGSMLIPNSQPFNSPISFTAFMISSINSFTPGGTGPKTYYPSHGFIEVLYYTFSSCDPGPIVSLQDIPKQAPADVPEADTLLLLGSGIFGLATWLSWKRHKVTRARN